MNASRLTILLIGLLLSIIVCREGQAAGDGTTDIDPTDLIWRLRNEEPLSYEEEKYLDLMSRERGMDDEQVAEHLERLWIKTQDRDGYEGITSRTTFGRKIQHFSEENPTFVSMGFLLTFAVGVLIFNLLFQRFLRARRERQFLTRPDMCNSVGDLLHSAERRARGETPSPSDEFDYGDGDDHEDK